MKNIKIGSRLGLGFGAILLIMVAIIAIGITRLAKVNAVSTDMAENRIPKVLMVEEIREQMNILARATRNALIMKDRADIKKELGRAQAARVHASGIYEKFDKVMVTPKGRAMLKSVVDQRGPYGVAVDKLARLIDAGQTEEARDLMLKDVRVTQAAYFERLEAFQKYFVDAMNKGHQEGDAAYAMARMLLIGLGVAAIVLGGVIAVTVTRSITRPINDAVKVAETVASGDLTSRIEVKSTDETGQLMQALKNMNDSLLDIVGRVRLGTDTIATASAQIAAGNQDLSARTEEQASSLEETASSMEEMTSTVRQNGENAQQANQLARTASDIATQGGAVVAEVVKTMNVINDDSKKMADIINVIDGIAFQTNILALNAAVEAARAGEQGRGFAVVATEVRNLAQRSAAAAREIKTLIDDSVSKVGAGTRLVDQAGVTMTEIVSSIQRVTDIMSEITAATREQVDGIEQINQAVTQMDQVTQQNAALVEEAAAAAESMQDQAGKLVEAVSIFRTGQAVNSTSAPAKPVKAPAKAASNLPPVRSPARSVAPRAPTAALPVSARQPGGVAPSADGDWEQF